MQAACEICGLQFSDITCLSHHKKTKSHMDRATYLTMISRSSSKSTEEQGDQMINNQKNNYKFQQ